LAGRSFPHRSGANGNPFTSYNVTGILSKDALRRYNEDSSIPDQKQVTIADGIDGAAENFTVAILSEWQARQGQDKIVMQNCTGDSPFAGYRQTAGDSVLQKHGLYDPELGTPNP